MLGVDHQIDVFYYIVNPGTDLEKIIKKRHSDVGEFSEKVERLVDKYGAEHANKTPISSGIGLSSLSFTYETAPLKNFKRSSFGCFKPSSNKVRKEFAEVRIDYLARRHEVMQGIRYRIVNGTILISCLPNKDGSRPEIKDAGVANEEQVKTLRGEIEKDGNFDLDRYYWQEQGFSKSSAFFQPSEESQQYEQEWWDHRWVQTLDALFLFKHSKVGMCLNRFWKKAFNKPLIP